MKSNFDCIIIGAGMAGMTSALYLKRAGINLLLLEKSAPGGQINMSPSVENYPGFNSVEGAILGLNVFEQIQNIGVNYQYGKVLNLKKIDDLFYIKTDIEEYTSKSVIIATGRKPQKLNLENEEDLIGKGISYCVLCDGNLFKDECVSLIGNDYRTLQEAIYLSNICSQVNLICEQQSFENSSLLLEKVNKLSNIKIYYSSAITKLIKNNDILRAIEIKNNDITQEITCRALFISNNNIPELDFISGLKNIDNYIIVDEKMQTNIGGLFACGDIIKKDVYQLTTAVGEATIAANSVFNYLSGR